MNPLRSTNAWRAAAFAGALALSGCVVVPADSYYGPGPAVIAAPPPQRAEVIGVAPYPGYVWIDGYWNWTGHRHEWVGGHWDAPRPGYRWVPRRWSHDRDGWRLHGGRWERGR
jgi:hypothetical protein